MQYLGKLLWPIIQSIGFWLLNKTAKAILILVKAAVDEVETMDWSNVQGLLKSEAKRKAAYDLIAARLKKEGYSIVSSVKDEATEISLNQVNEWIETWANKHP